MYELYSRRASKFSTAHDAAPTEKHLREYLDQKSNFADLTVKMMATLKHQAGLRNAAQGGYVFFTHFGRDPLACHNVAMGGSTESAFRPLV